MNNINKEDILDFFRQNKLFLDQKFGVTKIGLFGSYVRDEAEEESDIDILIEAKKHDPFGRIELKEFLEQHFQKKWMSYI